MPALSQCHKINVRLLAPLAPSQLLFSMFAGHGRLRAIGSHMGAHCLEPDTAISAAGSSASTPVFTSPARTLTMTPEWGDGERSVDGRPRVPDGVLERMKKVTIEEAFEKLSGIESVVPRAAAYSRE